MIHRIERKAGRIRVEASDNVRVAQVRVAILDAQGETLEQGQAAQAEGNWWEYVSLKGGKVAAEAWDLAGNVARSEMGNEKS